MGLDNCLKDRDIFGQPVTMRFMGEGTINTKCGGALSIVLRICMFLFAVETLYDFFNGSMNESSVVKADTSEAFYELNFEKFMTGYKIRHVYTKTNPISDKMKLDFEQ
jgi:hypothetical protein